MNYNRKLILEDGEEFLGFSFGSAQDRICEIVFNTSMSGYQEILSDPSYTYQAVVMTFPLIGNYGINEEDYESDLPAVGALIVREYSENPSNFRCTETLDHFMKRKRIPGIYGLDTRRLTRSIRTLGSRKALITSADVSLEECLQRIHAYSIPRDAVFRVSSPFICEYLPTESSVPFSPACHVVAIDCGMKRSIIRELNKIGCRVTVVPWNTSADTIEALHPDGVFISNGPGDPTDVPETADTVRKLIGKYPIFGICLGHQILALAYGARTYKLTFGHHGGNHPVQELATRRIAITSQNHSYAVDAASLTPTGLSVTHINLHDNTVEGMECRADRVFSVQYHPESAPGPQDSVSLFGRFLDMMRGNV